jgi:hypothetical protein
LRLPKRATARVCPYFLRRYDIDDVYVSAQAILTTPFRLPPIDEFHPIYLPIILKR